MKRPLGLFCIILLLGVKLSAQARFTHSELTWRTLEGEHFVVHYHQGTAWTATEVLNVAEDIYKPITELYQYQPENKTHLIIWDTDDFSNGASYYFDNKIDIWAMPLDYKLRGSHYWLRDVVTHEFTHIVSLRAARKFKGSISASYFQFIQYEPERRDDVLYGYPNALVSYPLPSVVVPMWWAEGVAQHQANGSRYDYWDSIRDMILRDRWLHKRLLSFNEMDGFGKGGIGNESVYNQGFSFVNYLAEHYGDEILERITERLTNPWNYSFYKALSELTGRSKTQLYRDWIAYLTERFKAELPSTDEQTSVSIFQTRGSANFYPRHHSASGRLAFISNMGEAYFGRTALFVQQPGEEPRRVTAAAGFAWSPITDTLVVVKKSFYDQGIPGGYSFKDTEGPHFSFLHKKVKATWRLPLQGSRYFDLYLLHPDNPDKLRRLTNGARAKNPVWSPDGKQIAFINLRDGTNNICIVEPAHPDSVRQLTRFTPGTQIYTLSWSPDGSRLLFDRATGYNRDIYMYDFRTKEVRPVFAEKWDERNPFWITDSTLLFSDDRTGIFNLYWAELNLGKVRQLTAVNGGAFQAELWQDTLFFSYYDSLGYKLAYLPLKKALWKAAESGSLSYLSRILKADYVRELAPRQGVPYRFQAGPMLIAPRLQVEYDAAKGSTYLKPGFYFFSSEWINKFNLLGGFDFGFNKDLDFFFLAEYRGFRPLLRLEFYRLVRNTQEELSYLNGIYKVQSRLQFTMTQGVASIELPIGGSHNLMGDFTLTNYNTYLAPHVLNGLPLGGISYDYFKGWDAGLIYRGDWLKPEPSQDINPQGLQVEIGARRNHHLFLSGYGYNEDTGNWGNIYDTFDYWRWSFNVFYARSLPAILGGKIGLRGIGAGLSRNSIDSFFYEFGGGAPGLRGYPYFSLGGTRKLIFSGFWRRPLFRDAYWKVGHYTLKDVYFGIHWQVGTAWVPDSSLWKPGLDFNERGRELLRDLNQASWLQDFGFSLRVGGFSFYAYPTALEISAYYAPEQLAYREDPDIKYGQEWRFYWSLLFAFN